MGSTMKIVGHDWGAIMGGSAVTADDIAVLRASFARVAPRVDEVADAFYRALFSRYPSTKALFGQATMAEQKRKLLGSLSLVIHNLERHDFLRAYLRGLGALHVSYGVRPEHYPLVCECLLEALMQTAGAGWTSLEDAAWRGALQRISETMLAGAGAEAPT